MNDDSKFFLGSDYQNHLDFQQIMKNIHDNGPWINAVNYKGETPVHMAAKYLKYSHIQTMLPYLKNIQACDRQGNNILHALLSADVKTENEYEKLITILYVVMHKRVDPNLKNINGITPVHLAVRHCDLRILDMFKRAKANFHQLTYDGDSVMFIACKSMLTTKGVSAGIITLEYLMKLGFNLNGKDNKGYSILHHAVNLYSNDSVRKLIKRGADFNSQTINLNLTPLHLAAQKDSVSIIKILIEAGANAKSLTTAGETPLHTAVHASSTKAMKSLIKHGVDINFPEYFTPLHLATRIDKKDMFKILINNGADVNVKSEDGLTPLHLAASYGNFDFVKALIDRNADVNCRDINNCTPLYYAIRKCDFVESVNGYKCHEKDSSIDELMVQSCGFSWHMQWLIELNIVELLIKNGSDVNSVTKHGVSLLHCAAKAGNDTFVKILLRNRARVNCEDTNLRITPLHIASISGNSVELFINAKADVNALTKDGCSPLHFAMKANNVEVMRLLMSRGADVNYKEGSTGYALLHTAVLNHREDIVEMLINANADVNSKTSDCNKSSLHLAVEIGDFKFVKIFLEHKAEVNSKSKSGSTPLHFACSNNFTDAVEALIKAGADVNTLNNDRKSPLHIAVEIHNMKIAKLLLANRANLNCMEKRCRYTLIYLISCQFKYASLNDFKNNVLVKNNYFGEIWLDRVLSELKEQKMMEMLLFLYAFVDSHNKSSCMVPDYAVTRDYNQHIESIKMFAAMNFQNFDVYSKTIYSCYRNDVFNDSFEGKYEYLKKLKALGIPLHETYQEYIDDSELVHLKKPNLIYNLKFAEEVEKMKTYFIKGNVSLYKFLHLSRKRRNYYSKGLDLHAIEVQFPNYNELIVATYNEALINGPMIIAAQVALRKLVKLEIPVLCVKEICWKLNVINVIALIQAARV